MVNLTKRKNIARRSKHHEELCIKNMEIMGTSSRSTTKRCLLSSNKRTTALQH